MKTYKLGSKIDCIIRSFSSCVIGSQEMLYNNQPYTILKDVSARLSFADSSVQSKTTFTQLAYNVDTLREITISDVELNDKILNLIFSKSEANLCSTMQNCDAEDNKIYITTSSPKIYQVFIYDVDGNLEQAFDELDTFEVEVARNENYIVFFAYEGDKVYKLSKRGSFYLTLDLIVTGNADDELNTSYIHINKCALEVDKDLSFNRGMNSVDLRFIVIDDNESYIVLE